MGDAHAGDLQDGHGALGAFWNFCVHKEMPRV